MVRWILSADRVGGEVRRRGGGEPLLLSSSERPGATGHGNLRQREGSGSDSASPAWPGEGRIHQIEYAMEAVKQGSATVGLKSKTHAVLVALKRAQSELAAHQKKILHVDNHIGISIAGLTADARLLCNFMRQECLDSRFVFDRPLPVSRLIPTQRYGRRPYGVGLLIAGYDDMGPHIFQTCPSANYFDCRAMSIGARSQSARTYLERHMSGFMECNLNELVKHGLRALRETLPAEQDLTTKNVSIGIVGKDLEFTIYDDDDVSPFLEGLEERPQRKAQGSSSELAEVQKLKSGSLLSLLMNLQKRLMNQWNIKLQASLESLTSSQMPLPPKTAVDYREGTCGILTERRRRTEKACPLCVA
ncbi:hypothetical protein GH733_001390, partial [Mirounga leonina]